MSSVKNKIQGDLKKALKLKEATKVSALRMLLSDIHNLEIQKRQELSDEQVMTILAQSLKRHQDSIAQFRQGGRDDLVQKEEAEVKVIVSYLPPQLDRQELEKLVEATVGEAKASGASVNMGAVMKILVPKIKGRASGQVVSDLVKQELIK